MLNIAEQKKLLRKKILIERRKFDENLFLEKDKVICQKIIKLIEYIKLFGSNFYIGIYYPLRTEPNLLKLPFLIDQNFALPIILGDEIEFVKYYPGDILERTNLKNLYQPAKKIQIIPDIIIMPGLSFDISGHRLGFGRGHHDKYFKKVKPFKTPVSIGVAYHEWLTDRLPFNEDDHKLNFILTDKILVKL